MNGTIGHDDYDYSFAGCPSYVPHLDAEGNERTPDVAQHPSASTKRIDEPEAVNVASLVADLEKIAAQHKALNSEAPAFVVPGLLQYYQDTIVWKAPQPPLPSYQEMTSKGKASWLLMLKVINNGWYGTNVRELESVLSCFLKEFFPHTNGKTQALTHKDKEDLESLFGIKDALLSHLESFDDRFEQSGAKFSKQ